MVELLEERNAAAMIPKTNSAMETWKAALIQNITLIQTKTNSSVKAARKEHGLQANAAAMTTMKISAAETMQAASMRSFSMIQIQINSSAKHAPKENGLMGNAAATTACRIILMVEQI